MADEFAEYIYGTKVRTSEDERVWELTPQSERRERVVRCRDCRRSFEERGELWCRGIVGPPIESEGFCAWGEPRKGNNDD